MYLTKAIDMLKKHEGLMLKPYRCTAGKLTIGYGRNIKDNGITEEEALIMLIADTITAEQELCEIFKDYDLFSDNRKIALIDMIFNLGKPRFLLFDKTIGLIKSGDWESAAGEALDSRWADQVGKRAITISEMLRQG